MDQPNFYTYLWLREDGTPYYVGKGQGRRAYTSNHHVTHRPTDKARIFIQYWESEEEAYEKELWYISLFGRKTNSTGILRNLSEGGVGPSTGSKRSKETREKIRKNLLGNKRNLGKHQSEEHKRNLSLLRTDVKFSEEHKERLRESHKGVPWSSARRRAQGASCGQN
jgi:hypothetical protein